MRSYLTATILLTALGHAAMAGAQDIPPPRKGSTSSEPDFAPWREVRLVLGSTKEAQWVKPFKMFDNLYYVGMKEYASYLMTTSGGLILIDPTFEHLASTVLDNVKALGFNPKDIKYLLITHAHGDHAGGTRVVKEATGAQVVMAPGDWDLFETPARGRAAGAPAAKMPRDVVAKDGQALTLGDTTVKLYITPGHTPGCLSMEYTVFDGGKPFKAITLGGSGLPDLERLDQYMRSHERMRALPDIQVMLSDHPYMADFYNLQRAFEGRKPGEPNPFVIGRQKVLAWYDEVLAAARRKQEYDQAQLK